MIRVALAILAACGGSAQPLALSAGTGAHHACVRAIRCQTIAEHEYEACVSCLEHTDKHLISTLRQQFGGIPPLEQLDCDFMAYVCQDLVHVAANQRSR